MEPPTLSRSTRKTAGIILLLMVSVEFGGYFLVQIVTGNVPQTAFQLSFSRAGHAHAGVLLILALVALVLADSTRSTGWFAAMTRLSIPAAAVLMSAGFFLSALGSGRTEPNPLIVLLWVGAVALAVGLVSLGVSLVRG